MSRGISLSIMSGSVLAENSSTFGVGNRAHLKHEVAIVLIASAVAPACHTKDGTNTSGSNNSNNILVRDFFQSINDFNILLLQI